MANEFKNGKIVLNLNKNIGCCNLKFKKLLLNSNQLLREMQYVSSFVDNFSHLNLNSNFKFINLSFDCNLNLKIKKYVPCG